MASTLTEPKTCWPDSAQTAKEAASSDLGPGNQVIIAGVAPSELSAASFLLE